LELSDDLDLTGLATALLALVTLASVVLTRRALKQTRDEIDLSRREVEEAHRPVLVPVIDPTREVGIPGHGRFPVGPQAADNRILVSVENIGSGPALDVSLTVALAAEHVPEAQQCARTTKTATGIGVGRITTLELPLVGATVVPFQLRLTYSDVAGKPWETTARYAIGMASRYEDLSIVALSTA
jgi:hypothetical protein